VHNKDHANVLQKPGPVQNPVDPAFIFELFTAVLPAEPHAPKRRHGNSDRKNLFGEPGESSGGAGVRYLRRNLRGAEGAAAQVLDQSLCQK